jgi:competence protein ComEC
MRAIWFALLLLWIAFIVSDGVPAPAFAAAVTPSDRVTSQINVREFPRTSDSRIIGVLRRGESAELVESMPHWYRVRLAAGEEGYVSKSWAVVVDSAPGYIPFELHVVDVGIGDALIINMGTKEIVVDGGNSTRLLHDYARDTGIIDDPIELVVVTHADSDHWKGLTRLLGFDGRATVPHTVSEFWEPGYDRSCGLLPSYAAFINDMRAALLPENFHRPLQATHPPATRTGTVQPFTLPSLPGVTFTVLHTEASPTGPDCAYQINNASVVLLVEISGVRMLLTGDANGKARDEGSPGTPGHIEEKLLALERQHRGTLKADILKVPHHGSETANTQAFIDAVAAPWVLISASTNHHLPRPTVVRRYESTNPVILRTDANRAAGLDHVFCASTGHGKVACNYRDQVTP